MLNNLKPPAEANHLNRDGCVVTDLRSLKWLTIDGQVLVLACVLDITLSPAELIHSSGSADLHGNRPSAAEANSWPEY